MLKARKILGCKAMTKKESKALTHLEAVGKSLCSQHLCLLPVSQMQAGCRQVNRACPYLMMYPLPPSPGGETHSVSPHP